MPQGNLRRFPGCLLREDFSFKEVLGLRYLHGNRSHSAQHQAYVFHNAVLYPIGACHGQNREVNGLADAVFVIDCRRAILRLWHYNLRHKFTGL